MFTAFGKPSRLKDVMGVFFLAGTGLLYAFGVSHETACEGCGELTTAPAESQEMQPSESPAAPFAPEGDARGAAALG